MRLETLPDSDLPALLLAGGYSFEPIGESQRILPRSIVEQFTRRGDGTLELLTPGSTKPVAEMRTHAGIARTLQYELRAQAEPDEGTIR